MRLAAVHDPELDESVAELGFIQDVRVDEGNRVHVRFHLPTYWCAANFAFLMASEMRERVEELPWVAAVTVELTDHFYAERINHGIGRHLSFSETFPDEATGNLDELRSVLRRKAFQRRQETLLRYLLERAYTPAALIGLEIRELAALAIEDGEDPRLLQRYLAIRGEWGGDASPSSRAFITAEGRALDPGTFSEYLRKLRLVSLNIEFNGAICRGLLHARYGGPGRARTASFRMAAHSGARAAS